MAAELPVVTFEVLYKLADQGRLRSSESTETWRDELLKLRVLLVF